MLWETLKIVPVEGWVGLAGILFGSLLTTFGVWLTNRANQAQLKKQHEHEHRMVVSRLSKERFEELYILVTKWLNSFFSNYLHLKNVMRDLMSYAEYQRTLIDQGSTVDFSRIEMIVDIYGGEILEFYDKVISARKDLNDIISEHKFSYERGGSGEVFIEPLDRAQIRLERCLEEFRIAIAKAARDS